VHVRTDPQQFTGLNRSSLAKSLETLNPTFNIMTIIGVCPRSGADLARIWRETPPHGRVGGGGVYVYENAHTALEIDPPPPPLLKNTTCHKILKIFGG